MASTVASLIANRSPLSDLAAFCDSLPPEERMAQVLSLSRQSIRDLYALAQPPEGQAGGAPVALLVPADLPAGRTVTWTGKNSLPAFSRFSKRFTRSAEPGAIIGMNSQWSSFATGPGYFIAASCQEHPAELLFDYTRYPNEAPPGWPAVHPNESGLAAIVYGRMLDHVRPVGLHVLVGAAFSTSGKPRNIFFALTRGPTLPVGN